MDTETGAGSDAGDDRVTAGPEGVIIDPTEARRRERPGDRGRRRRHRPRRPQGRPTGLATPQAVFESAAAGDKRAAAVVEGEARLVAAAICCVISVVDPSLIVLGGGIGQAPGFAEEVTRALAEIAPVLPEVKVSALGTDVVVDGFLAEATAMAWTQLIASLP